MNPGIYTLTHDEYHGDPTPTPSLSASMIKILCAQSPAHARAAHPKLSLQPVKEESEVMDFGSAAHSLLLEGQDAAVIIDADNWRTKAAREQRDQARAAGKFPMLACRWIAVEQMVDAVRSQIHANKEAANMFTAGKPEQTLIWEEDGIWCRARLDWLHGDYRFIDDFKTTGATASPEVLSRTLFTNGWDIQAAWYLRGLEILTGKKAQFRFFVQETYLPHAGCVMALDSASLVIGEKKCLYGIEKWQECLKSGIWPGYPNHICYADLPPWEEARWLQKEEMAL